MPRLRHTVEPILTKLREAKVAQAKRLKELEREHTWLKHAVADLTPDQVILKEAAEGHGYTRHADGRPCVGHGCAMLGLANAESVAWWVTLARHRGISGTHPMTGPPEPRRSFNSRASLGR